MRCVTMVMKELNMDYITQIQKEYVYFTDMLKSIEKIKKKTPGNGFTKMKCKEHMDSLIMMFDAIDQGKVLIND